MPQSQMIPARYSFSGMIEDVLSCELAGVGNDFLLVLAYREGSVVFWNVEEKTVSSLFSSSMLQLSDILFHTLYLFAITETLHDKWLN